jgi:hypothetical protein
LSPTREGALLPILEVLVGSFFTLLPCFLNFRGVFATGSLIGFIGDLIDPSSGMFGADLLLGSVCELPNRLT